MKSLSIAIFILFLSVPFLRADIVPVKKTFTKSDILKLSSSYLNNGLNINKPAIVDVDGDGDFDILNFTNSGNVEYYKNTGSLESPVFVLENKHFDHFDVSTFLPSKLPVPVFFADKDGDNDKDMFAIVKDNNKYEVMYIENTMDLDQYTLITVILILLIVLLVVLIVR